MVLNIVLGEVLRQKLNVPRQKKSTPKMSGLHFAYGLSTVLGLGLRQGVVSEQK
jgi:hypothetical protein